MAKTRERADPPIFSLVEHKGLIARLRDELRVAAAEFVHNPALFIGNLFLDRTSDSWRRRRIYAGLALAVAAHIVLLIVIVLAGWHRILAPVETDENAVSVTMLQGPLGLSDGAKPVEAPGDKGGGGGQSSPEPASKGVPPRMLPLPQIVQPNPSNIDDPSLPIPATLVGPEGEPPPPSAPGIADGRSGEFAPGTGSGGGLGRGTGSGAGAGSGPGQGLGAGGGRGSNPVGTGDGSGTGTDTIDWRRFTSVPGSTPFSWTYKARPVVTPEAQANQVSGTVLLRATFRFDGRITDIKVVNAVDFMTESAVEALRRSRFRPATVNGVPVTLTNVLVKIEVHYGRG